jgi:hypothetical protein
MKKGQLISMANGPWLITMIVMIALIVAAGAVAINAFKTSPDTTAVGTDFYSDSEFVGINSTYVDFTPSDLVYDGVGNAHIIGCSDAAIINDTDSIDLTTSFTVSGCTARLDVVELNESTFHANFTYTYHVYKASYNVSNKGEVSLGNFSVQLPTTGTMLGVGLILVVVIGIFAYFAKGRE